MKRKVQNPNSETWRRMLFLGNKAKKGNQKLELWQIIYLKKQYKIEWRYQTSRERKLRVGF